MIQRLLLAIIIILSCEQRAMAHETALASSYGRSQDAYVQAVVEDSYRNVWMGTREGISLYDGVKIRHYYHEEDDSCSLMNDDVTAIIELIPGKVLVGTQTGLCCFDYSQESFSPITLFGISGDALSVKVSALKPRPDGTVLVICADGNQCVVYLQEDHIEARHCLDPSSESESEECEEETRIHQEYGLDGWSDEEALKVRLVGLYLYGELVKAGQQSGGYTIYKSWIGEAEKLDFCHSDNHIGLELTTLADLQNVTYESKINDGNWIELGRGQNRVVLNNLEPGVYSIKLRAKCEGMTGEISTVDVIVHSPWYASLWMFAVYFLILLSTFFIVYRHVRVREKDKQIKLEKKQQEDMAEARIQFFMNVSHEIRSPMSLIHAPLEKLKQMGDDEEHMKCYDTISQNSQRILQLINQMIEVRKIERGQMVLQYQKVEVVSLLQRQFEAFQASSHRVEVDFSYLHSVEKLDVQVDPQVLEKIVMNLLSASLKFISTGGSITMVLTVNREKKVFQIAISDTGIGIAPQNRSHIFECFYSGVHPNGYIGTGIGLNHAYLLVQLLHGEIRVVDNPDGKGNRFELELPIRGKLDTE